MTTKNVPLLFQAKISDFEAAREALLAFRNKNAKLIEQHDLLVQAHNSALAEVKAEYKKNHEDIGPRYGDFSVTQTTHINAKLLLDLLPNAEAAVKIVPQTYSIDREEYKRLVKAGAIPSEVIEKIETVGTISVRGPKEA